MATAQYFLFVFFGLLAGSLLNVVITRLPVMRRRALQIDVDQQHRQRFDLLLPGSHCPACGTAVPPWRNIPIISWLLQRGIAVCCGARIPFRYLCCELLIPILFAVVGWLYTDWLTALTVAFSLMAAVAAALLALETGLPFDSPLYLLLWLGLLSNAALLPLADLQSALISAVVVWMVAYFVIVRSGDPNASGWIPLAAVPAAWLGWPGLVLGAAVVALAGAGFRSRWIAVVIPLATGFCILAAVIDIDFMRRFLVIFHH